MTNGFGGNGRGGRFHHNDSPYFNEEVAVAHRYTAARADLIATEVLRCLEEYYQQKRQVDPEETTPDTEPSEMLLNDGWLELIEGKVNDWAEANMHQLVVGGDGAKILMGTIFDPYHIAGNGLGRRISTWSIDTAAFFVPQSDCSRHKPGGYPWEQKRPWHLLVQLAVMFLYAEVLLTLALKGRLASPRQEAMIAVWERRGQFRRQALECLEQAEMRRRREAEINESASLILAARDREKR